MWEPEIRLFPEFDDVVVEVEQPNIDLISDVSSDSNTSDSPIRSQHHSPIESPKDRRSKIKALESIHKIPEKVINDHLNSRRSFYQRRPTTRTSRRSLKVLPADDEPETQHIT
jgi:hypothetical protein